MNVPKVAYRKKLLLFWLLTCLGISYSTAFLSSPIPPLARAHFTASAAGADSRRYTTGSSQPVASIPGEGEAGDCPPPNKNIPGREYLFAASKF